MDPTLLAGLNGPQWSELQRLSRKNRLSEEQVLRFEQLYRRASKDLSRLQTVAPESDVTAYVSRIVLGARVHFGAVPVSAGSSLGRFFLQSLPSALYSLRWYFLAVTVFFFLVAVSLAVWALSADGVLDSVLPADARGEIAERGFVEYYRENPHAVFALGVWVNNAWIALQFVVLGITGYYVVVGLVFNAANVGIMAAAMYEAGCERDFWQFILPHGVPEIMCILIAAAAGLKIFTAWIIPRNMTRRQGLAQEARSLITVGAGLVLFLFLSGLIEGFITPSTLPFVLKMPFGLALAGGILAYAVVLGRPAQRAGALADLDAERAGYRLVTAD